MSVDKETQAQIDRIVAVAQQSMGNRFEEDEKRGLRDPQTGRFKSHLDLGADDKLNVQFSTERVLNKTATYDAGGVNQYTAMDFVTITIPGNRDLTVHAPVTDYYQWRFPVEFDAFKRGQNSEVKGTPLEKWAALNEGQIAELKHQGIRTVEQVATLSDSVSGVMRGFYALKFKAQAFLEDGKQGASDALVVKQLAQQETRHAAEMQALKAEMAAMLAEAMGKGRKSKPDDSAKD